MPRRLAPFVLAAALVAIVLTGALDGPAAAPPARAQAQGPVDDPAKPLVYVFSIDAQDGDRAIDQQRAPFLASLVRGEEGARASYYRESRGIMVSETNPNHTAMVTGAYGERSGIPGNTFAVSDAAGQRDCPIDSGSTDPFGGAQEEPPRAGQVAVTSGEAATCLLAETFFTALERRAPDVVTAGIFGKPKLARIFETRLVNPGGAPDDFDADHLFAPCEQSSDDPPYCRDVPIDPAQRYTDDNVVMDEVIRTVDEGVGSDRRRPNLTFVNLPDVDQIGHATGAGPAYENQIATTDQQIRRFVEHQKSRGLWSRTIMVVTSDHSMDSTMSPQPNALATAFGADADAVEIVLNGSVNMVYLKDRARPDADALLARLRAAALTNATVDEALYRRPNAADGGDRFTLDAVHPGWRIAGERTGDLLVTAKPTQKFGDGIPGGVNPLNGNHGAPQTLDHTFAIISGGGQVVQQAIDGVPDPAGRFSDTLQNPQQAEQVDIAPTVMALFGRRAPADSQGRVLTEAFTAGALPPVVDALPTPEAPRGGLPVAGGGGGGGGGGDGGAFGGGPSCEVLSGFRSLSVRPRGRGLRVAFARRTTAPVQVDVFRQSAGRTVLGNRLVARFTRSRSFTWSGRGTRARTGDGFYFARVRTRLPGGRVDERRFPLQRAGGRFRSRPAFDRPASCGLLANHKLERTVFGGRGNRPVGVAFRLNREARVRVELLRGTRVVRRLGERTRAAGVTQRLRLTPERLARGEYTVRLTATSGDQRVVSRLRVRRL